MKKADVVDYIMNHIEASTKAVRLFQSEHNLITDGIVGKITFKKLVV